MYFRILYIAATTVVGLLALCQAARVTSNSPPIQNGSTSQSSTSHIDETVIEKTHLYKQAHEQLLHLAKLEEESNRKQAIERRKLKRIKRFNARWSQDTIHRRPKASLLGLHRDSPLPKFAVDLTVRQAERQAELNNWHHHRNLLHSNHISQKDLPLHLQASSGELRLKQIKKARSNEGEEKAEAQEKVLRRILSNKESNRLRNAKVKKLGLHTNSALPAFAFQLPIQQLEKHENLQVWHHYRELMEHNIITPKELPNMFKTVKGTFRLKKPSGRLSINAKLAHDQLKSKFNTEPQDNSARGKASVPLLEQIQSRKTSIGTSSGHSSDDWDMFRGQLDEHNSGSDDEVWNSLRSQLD